MDFSKSIYWRGGCPPFARAASPRPRFASFTTPSPSLSPFRTRAPMCLPFRSCAAPPPGLRSAPPRPHTLRATPPLAARARVASSLVPCTPFACVRAALPLARTSSRARRVTREGRGSTPRAEGAELGAPTLLHPRGSAGVAGGWTHRPSPLRARAAGLAWPARRGGRTVPPLANASRAVWDAWGWVGVASAEEDWAVRAVPPLAAGYVGLGWRGPRGGVGAPSLLSRMRAGRGGARGAGQAAEGDWGGHAVLRAPAGRGLGDVPSCAPFPRERGGADRGEGADVSSFRADKADVGEKGPRAPYLRAKGAAVGKGRGIGLSSRVLFSTRMGGGREEWGSVVRVSPKQVVPATSAVQNRTNWACKERRTLTPPPTPPASPLLSSPLLPLPSPTPLVSESGRSAPARSHAERELTGVCRPLSAPPYSRETGAHEDKERTGVCRLSPCLRHPVRVEGGPRCPPPPSPSLLPVAPRSHGMGAHKGTPTPVPPFPFAQKRCARGLTAPLLRVAPASSPPPSLLSAPPPFARKGACEGNAPSRGAPFAREGAHEAKPSPPPHVSRSRVGTAQKTGTQEGHAPAHPCPRTQEGAQRAHRAPWRRRRQPSPTPPTHARGGTARPPSPLRAGDASPATRTSHRTARARKGKGRRIQPLRTGYAGPVFTRPAMPADAGGSGASPGLRPGGGACKGAARKHARTRRVMDRGTVQPGGGERRGVRIGTEVRKGEGDGDGGGVVNEAKRSQGETARVNGGHPAPVDRLRKIHVK
ncbi:hypothetical protein EDB84DRAFT_1629087 [Lactarius hengduanensis]|nr:hypothetical protein EDB84DRAFT_1629087 [Lactarius hengduanensis]